MRIAVPVIILSLTTGGVVLLLGKFLLRLGHIQRSVQEYWSQ